jgi:hypothetical protein
MWLSSLPILPLEGSKAVKRGAFLDAYAKADQLSFLKS